MNGGINANVKPGGRCTFFKLLLFLNITLHNNLGSGGGQNQILKLKYFCAREIAGFVALQFCVKLKLQYHFNLATGLNEKRKGYFVTKVQGLGVFTKRNCEKIRKVGGSFSLWCF